MLESRVKVTQDSLISDHVQNMPTRAQLLVQTPAGDMQLQQTESGDIRCTEVLVRFMAAPINPLDLLIMTGTYPVKPKYEHEGNSVLGYDGIGEVLQCGAKVHDLHPGDIVVPSMFGIGMLKLRISNSINAGRLT